MAEKNVPVFRYIFGLFSILMFSGIAVAATTLLYNFGAPLLLLLICDLVAVVAVMIYLVLDCEGTLDKFAVGGTVLLIFAGIGLVFFTLGSFFILAALGAWCVIGANALFISKFRTEMFWRKRNGHEVSVSSGYGMSMGWYGAVKNGLLYAFCALDLCGGIILCIMPGGFIYGFAAIAMAVLAMVAQYGLKHFCAGAPAALYSLIIAHGLLPVVVVLDVFMAGGADLVPSAVSVAGYAVATMLVMIPNVVYFSKRRDLFDN